LHVVAVEEGGRGEGELTECAAGLHVKTALQRGTPTKGKWKPVNAVHELSDGLKKDDCATSSAARFAAN
jgi:hypothetical protein